MGREHVGEGIALVGDGGSGPAVFVDESVCGLDGAEFVVDSVMEIGGADGAALPSVRSASTWFNGTARWLSEIVDRVGCGRRQREAREKIAGVSKPATASATATSRTIRDGRNLDEAVYTGLYILPKV
ncbi:hypothetical protein ACWFRB_08355 [Rhodococcus sp. NPDC055112]